MGHGWSLAFGKAQTVALGVAVHKPHEAIPIGFALHDVKGFNASGLTVDELAIDVATDQFTLFVHQIHTGNFYPRLGKRLGVIEVKGGRPIRAILGAGKANIGNDGFCNATGKLNLGHAKCPTKFTE
jgi:hypothetical protein